MPPGGAVAIGKTGDDAPGFQALFQLRIAVIGASADICFAYGLLFINCTHCVCATRRGLL